MKEIIYQTKQTLALVLGLLAFTTMLFTACDSDDIGDNYYTFTGEMLGEYLEARPETFEEFTKVIERADLSGLLNAYGSYTCFAPDNKAMQEYYNGLGISSLDELSQEDVTTLAYTHIIKSVYQTADLTVGAIGTPNMNERYLMVSFGATTSGSLEIIINTNSRIISRDQDVENGFVHTIDKVLEPSNAQLPDLISENEDLSLFYEALVATGLDDELRLVEDKEYVPVDDYKGINETGEMDSPPSRKYGYTAFVETNAVYAANNIHNLDDLKRYAAQIYDAMYPEDAGITDIKDRRNSLNRFVAYHLIEKTIYYNNMVFTTHKVETEDAYEFIETMCPNTLLEVREGLSTEGVVINKYDNSYIQVLSIDEESADQNAINGIYHLIDGILVYDNHVRDKVLNKRIRFDSTALSPEFMTNGIRGVNKSYCFPPGYLKYFEYSDETRFFYLHPTAHWANYQGDELMATRQYDFTMRLLPIPKGTYELRIGYTANNSRGVAQFYVDGSPAGIPLDLRITADNPKIGWVADSATDDEGVENDKMMRNRGYMKGPDTHFKTENGTRMIMRNNRENLRLIIGTYTFDEDGPHYLRIKSILEADLPQFHLDYLEWVPKSVYGGAEAEDKH